MRGYVSMSGRTSWGGVNIKARVSTRKPRELIFIEGKGPVVEGLGQVGFDYAELAGIVAQRPKQPMSKGW
jgi:hypothetical protein